MDFRDLKAWNSQSDQEFFDANEEIGDVWQLRFKMVDAPDDEPADEHPTMWVEAQVVRLLSF